MEDHYKVLYDYDAQRNDELSLQVGDKVRIIQGDNGEWCTAENLKTSQQGLVPTNFLEKIESNDTSAAGDNDGPVLATVLQDYAAQDHDELSLWKNGVVTVLDQSIADGWWKGDLNGKTGVFPANHVKLIDAHEQVPDVDENDKSRRQSFKLAAYGVKQGGIGSILAGGFSLKKKGTKKEETTSTQQQQPQSQQHTTEQPSARASDNKSLHDNSEIKSHDGHEKAMVVSAYDPQNDDELQLLPGAYVTIIDKLDNEGWWKGLNEKNELGMFPSNFVQILSSEGVPVRPARARPPTIKTDQQQQQKQQPVLSPTGMAKPPPVPVGTRPSSLLSRRPTGNSDQSAPPLPRPITSPPLPSTRRANSVIKESSTQPQSAHKRTPSIPLMSPDLPPIRQDQQHSHDQHALRPSRPVPSPGSANIGSNVTSPTSPTSEDRTAGLAKVPKNFGKPPGGPIPPARTSRPNSQASSVNAITTDASPLQTIADEANDEHGNDNDTSSSSPMPPPRVPKRSMPPVPNPTTHTIAEEQPRPIPSPRQQSREPSNDSKAETAKPSSTSASSSLSSSSSSTSFTSPISASDVIPPPPQRKTERLHSSNNDHIDGTDPLEMKLHQWFKEEAEAMRRYFESQLEEERSERLKLEMELESLKRQLS
ncbi:unnamed protein product [Absidia cylindrospora]